MICFAILVVAPSIPVIVVGKSASHNHDYWEYILKRVQVSRFTPSEMGSAPSLDPF